MSNATPPTITRATRIDIPGILAVQRRAFVSEAKIYGDHIRPMVETEGMFAETFDEGVVLKGMVDEHIIGSVRAHHTEPGRCYIGRLSVDPDFQNRGYAKALLRAVYDHFPDCDIFELFTGARSEKNNRFYESLGYERLGVTDPTKPEQYTYELHKKSRKDIPHKMTTPIIMCGAAGRMGQAILRCASENPAYTIIGGTEMIGSPLIGTTVGALLGKPALEAPIAGSLAALPNTAGAVAIHFSSPQASIDQLTWSVANKLPAVIGTTGFDHDQRIMIEEAASQIPIVYAPNMSVGVNTLFKIVGEVARILGEDFDVEITEMHHRFKKDAPSGTARRLGEIVAQAMGGSYEELVVDGRSGMPGERPSRQIGMHAIRGGDVVGDHTVTFAALGERIELTHKAHSRDTLARGSLRAAAWLIGKAPGLYDMQDVLGLR
ncbi:TPA: 4-hydroxy-tetrahydrodipicolinate reductase [Candidatus Sumerlaeota bacterium]|nr:4-hydroxy-tetrahydrodipicolinate reductase [Candidatus Sumerlaeota bacterium]